MEGEKNIMEISENISKHLFKEGLKKDQKKKHDTSYFAFKFIINKDKIEKEVKFPEKHTKSEF